MNDVSSNKNDKKEIVVYTAITNHYDDLKELSCLSNNCDYICFTDNPNIQSKTWTIKNMENLIYDHNRNAKQYKIFPHLFLEDYEYSLWIDGSIDIIGDIEELIKTYLVNAPIAFLRHEERNCIYEELDALISNGRKDNAEVMRSQVEKYKNLGYPKNIGLITATIILRKHNDLNVIHIMEEWWKEIINHSKRDQLSFNYVAWKNNFKFTVIPNHIYNNHYFTRDLHRWEMP